MVLLRRPLHLQVVLDDSLQPDVVTAVDAVSTSHQRVNGLDSAHVREAPLLSALLGAVLQRAVVANN